MPKQEKATQHWLLQAVKGTTHHFAPLEQKYAKANGRRPMTPKAPKSKRGK